MKRPGHANTMFKRVTDRRTDGKATSIAEPFYYVTLAENHYPYHMTVSAV